MQVMLTLPQAVNEGNIIPNMEIVCGTKWCYFRLATYRAARKPFTGEIN